MPSNIPFTSYSDRLIKLNHKSLEYRRLEFDLILVYKICYELVDIPYLLMKFLNLFVPIIACGVINFV